MTNLNFPSLFKGSWTFTRTVKGGLQGPLAFEGRASFTLKKSHTLYEESGSYTLKNQPIDFSASYLYEFNTPEHCRILFPDQRFFYELTTSQQSIEHICGQDQYKGNFEALSLDHWTLNWQIKGPRKKDIEIMTSYFRL